MTPRQALRIAGYNMAEVSTLEQSAARYSHARVEVAALNADLYERAVLEGVGRSGSDHFDLYDISVSFAERVASGFEDLTDLVSEPPSDPSDPLFRSLCDQLFVPHAGIVGAPWRSSSYVLVYRKDLARRLDLPPPDTIARAIELARTVRERIGIFGYTAAKRAALHQALDWLPFLWDFGGDIFQDGRVALDSPAAVRALSAYVELNSFGSWQSLHFEYGDPIQRLLDRSAAMCQAWAPEVHKLLERSPRPGDFDVLPGLGTPVRGGGGLGTPRGSESREATRAFLRWLIDPQQDVERVSRGGSPIYDSTADRLPKSARTALWTASREAYRKGRSRPKHPEWPAIQSVLARVAREAQTSGGDLRGLLSEAAQEIRLLAPDAS